ncbi:MAG: S-layer family protein, partial [Bacteroidetes bacterium]
MKQILQSLQMRRRVWLTRLCFVLGLLVSPLLAYGQVTVTGADATTNAGSPYATLKAAFDNINLASQTGNVIVISVTGNTTETASAVLNAGTWTSITISPTGGATRTISGGVTGHLIDFNGADNVTIDGLNTGGDALVISNTATGNSSALRLTNDASNNTITKCMLQGSGSSAGAGVIMFATGTAGGNDGNNINNCNITAAGSNLPINAVVSTGSASPNGNSGNTINANNIFDYFNAGTASAGVNLSNTGGANSNTGWTITNNRFYQTANRSYTAGNTHNAILIQTGSGYDISGNVIGFANASGTGTTNMIGVNTLVLGGTFPTSYTITSGTSVTLRYVAISCTFTAGGTVSNIQGNTISGIALLTLSGASTGNGIFCGISVASGIANIGTTTGNTIGATTGVGSIYTACTSTGGSIVGINVGGANTINIQNNTMGAISASGTSATISGGFVGVESTGHSGNITISNNTIGNATAENIRTGYLLSLGNLGNANTLTSTTGGTSAMAGIRMTSSTGNILAYNNNTMRGWATSGTVIAVTGISSAGTMTGTTPSVTANSNAMGTSSLGFVRYAAANSGALTGISVTNTVATSHQINGNDFRGITYAVAGSHAHTYINLAGATAANNVSQINNNTFTNLSVNTTGSVTFINHTYDIAATGSLTVDNNAIVTAFNKGGAGGTVTGFINSSGSPAGATFNLTNNNFSNITVTGATTVDGVNNTDGGTINKNLSNNIFSNWTCGTSQVRGMRINFGGGAGGSGNTINNNTISNISGGGVVQGISIGTSGTIHTLSGNLIHTLSSSGASAVTGIFSDSPTGNIQNNKIYGLSSSSASGTVFGITVNSGAHNISNNLIGTLTASTATGNA